MVRRATSGRSQTAGRSGAVAPRAAVTALRAGLWPGRHPDWGPHHLVHQRGQWRALCHHHEAFSLMPLIIRRWVRATLYVIVGLGSGALLVSLGIAIAERGPPTEVLSQSDAGAQVASHDNRIFLYYQVNRTRLCRVETARWL